MIEQKRKPLQQGHTPPEADTIISHNYEAARTPVTKYGYSTDDEPVEARTKKKKRGRAIAEGVAGGIAKGVGYTLGVVIWEALFGNC